MAASKSGFMKDALILFAITLVSGLCLGVVYDVTKAPIEAATIAANNATYKQVLPDADNFSDVEGSTEKIAETADEIANLGFGGVEIEPVLEAKDASGAVVGHVINSLSTAGGLKGPRRNAKYINAKFMDYPLKKGVYYGTTYVDFPSREQVLKIVETNFE